MNKWKKLCPHRVILCTITLFYKKLLFWHVIHKNHSCNNNKHYVYWTGALAWDMLIFPILSHIHTYMYLHYICKTNPCISTNFMHLEGIYQTSSLSFCGKWTSYFHYRRVKCTPFHKTCTQTVLIDSVFISLVRCGQDWNTQPPTHKVDTLPQ